MHMYNVTPSGTGVLFSCCRYAIYRHKGTRASTPESAGSKLEDVASPSMLCISRYVLEKARWTSNLLKRRPAPVLAPAKSANNTYSGGGFRVWGLGFGV